MPDFQRFYGLRLADALETLHPVELDLLIRGLPADSLYQGRLLGERDGGWGSLGYMLLDTRNSVEAIRTMLAGKKAKYREYVQYPGRDLSKRETEKARKKNIMSAIFRKGTREVQ